MATKFISTLSLLLLVGIASTTSSSGPSWMGDHCTSDNECEPGYCCTYSPMRYSIPKCERLGKINDQCNSAALFDGQFTYPDGTHLNVTGLHHVVCPCEQNLQCSQKGICTDSN